ncbi:MAG: proteasome-activating nucleotidase [archaeon GB-1867-097]|nr:proteasome-activating nucleotidase [Candidatus Culexmicrobium thermophilum]MCS7384383.1 proteasome-activating nucleotidase [Candidatus Culexmicrobium thermophilum]RLE56944.1 MAG: proteasome-activating nucleotidase [Candidatus Verstraetearchaeota archaeon]HDO20139.1 AAA family ATPase [Candidatus Bathyarchaeota archaeon]
MKYLEEKLKRIEIEYQLLNEEKERLMQEIAYLREELMKLKTPPLIEAYVVEVLDNSRAVVKSSTGPNLIVQISSLIDRGKLKPYTRVALNQRTFAIVEILPQIEDPYVRTMEVIEKPKVTYRDIGGLKEQIMLIKETVEIPLKNPTLFDEVGIEPPKGVLLYGPPGCGKTLLAKAVARETNATFIRVVGSELVKKYIGEGARMVRELFSLAKRKAPSIVFIDEIDAIGARRFGETTSGEREVQRTMSQLLSELDGFNPRGNVKIIAATNRIDILDPALLRPGRFDRIIEVPLPNREARLEIFKIHTRRMRLAENISIEILADKTENMSGADIKAICTEAGMNAIREGRRRVTMRDFEEALEKIMLKKKTGRLPVTSYL